MILLLPSEKVVPLQDQPVSLSSARLHVKIRREPWSPTFTFTLSNGNSEEIDCGPESNAWFKARGADMAVVEKALDYAYNFYKAEVVINNPKEPIASNARVKPRL